MTLTRYHSDDDAAVAGAITLHQQYSLPGSKLKLVSFNRKNEAGSNN